VPLLLFDTGDDGPVTDALCARPRLLHHEFQHPYWGRRSSSTAIAARRLGGGSAWAAGVNCAMRAREAAWLKL
jgi:hypothetical protein